MTPLPRRFRPAAEWLRLFSEQTPGVSATYVGGSLVTGRVDEWSDLDATVVTIGGTRTEVFHALLAALARDWQVEHRWTPPTPTWHGGLQVFAHLGAPAGADPTGTDPVLVDIVVDDARPQWLAVDPVRHGHPVVLHDPGGVVTEQVADPDEASREAATSALEIAERLPVARWIVLKSVARGQWPEAYAAYLRLGLEPLVQLLRTLHSPQRWDFGLRYLDSDLPDDARAEVRSLLPTTPDALGGQAERCFARQAEVLRALRGEDPGAVG